MKIFLSAPYTIHIDSDTGLIQDNFRAFLQKIIDYFQNRNIEVVSAHLREEWGADIYTPEKAIVSDFSSIIDVDFIVAYIGVPPSPGVLMELGFAASLKKRIFIIAKKNEPIPYLAQGLNEWTQTEFIYFNEISDLFLKCDKLIVHNK
jgi:nucleoside 2-deoxyribosyltransferase